MTADVRRSRRAGHEGPCAASPVVNEVIGEIVLRHLEDEDAAMSLLQDLHSAGFTIVLREGASGIMTADVRRWRLLAFASLVAVVLMAAGVR